MQKFLSLQLQQTELSNEPNFNEKYFSEELGLNNQTQQSDK